MTTYPNLFAELHLRYSKFLGTLNTVGAIQQTDWDRWSKDNPENFARWTTSLVYAGALLGGKYAKDIALKSPSISEGDVAFLNTSMGLGYLNSILLAICYLDIRDPLMYLETLHHPLKLMDF